MLLSRLAVWPLAPSLSLLPLVYRQRHAMKIGVSSSMAKYGTAYPPHSYINQSKYRLNINKIPQATEKLLLGSDV